MGKQINKRLAKWLTQMRLKARFPPELAAQALGISLATFNSYESGEPIPLYLLVQLAELYEILPELVLAKIHELEHHSTI